MANVRQYRRYPLWHLEPHRLPSARVAQYPQRLHQTGEPSARTSLKVCLTVVTVPRALSTRPLRNLHGLPMVQFCGRPILIPFRSLRLSLSVPARPMLQDLPSPVQWSVTPLSSLPCRAKAQRRAISQEETYHQHPQILHHPQIPALSYRLLRTHHPEHPRPPMTGMYSRR